MSWMDSWSRPTKVFHVSHLKVDIGQKLKIGCFEYSMLLHLRHYISRLEVTQFLTVILVGGSSVRKIESSWQDSIGPVLDCICPDR